MGESFRRLVPGIVLVLAIFVSVSAAQLHHSDVAALREMARNLTIFNWDPNNAEHACTTFQYPCAAFYCGVRCDETNTYVKDLYVSCEIIRRQPAAKPRQKL